MDQSEAVEHNWDGNRRLAWARAKWNFSLSDFRVWAVFAPKKKSAQKNLSHKSIEMQSEGEKKFSPVSNRF